MQRLFLLFLIMTLNTYTNQLDIEYSKEFTDLVELVYGPEFLSQGGKKSINRMFEGQELENKKILDIGSGLGGVDFYLAQNYAVDIIGVDCVARLVEEAKNRKALYTLKGDVTFIHQEPNIFIYPFSDNSFDIIFSKEALLHVAEKDLLLKELFRVLKPGGQIIILDWLVDTHNLGIYIKKMMEIDGLDLKMATLKEYKDYLRAAGFNTMFSLFMNDQYIGYTTENIEQIISHKTKLIERLGEQSYNYSLETWTLQKKIFECNEVLVTLLKANKS